VIWGYEAHPDKDLSSHDPRKDRTLSQIYEKTHHHSQRPLLWKRQIDPRTKAKDENKDHASEGGNISLIFDE